jgi:uncharacterized protein (TIGR02391 family)
MSKSLLDFLLRDPDDLLALEPQELAEGILAYIGSLPPEEQNRLNRYSFGLPHMTQGWPHDRQKEISRVLMEGWVQLERDGLLIQKPEANDQSRILSRQGQRLAAGGGFKEFRASRALPHALLHPMIEERCRGDFVRGEYESAIVKAFKGVEVAVREAARLTDRDIGVPLMRKAFDVSNGPLTDFSLLEAERQAVSDLFAGAIGLFKNPSSHRWIEFKNPAEAAEAIIFASQLLRIVEARRKTEESSQ